MVATLSCQFEHTCGSGAGTREAHGNDRLVIMFGVNGSEMLIIIIVALVVIGPKRIPEYAQKLRDLVRQARRMAEGAKDSVKRDFGDDLGDVDWQKLDPRQYDPRRIVREALAEEDSALRESKLKPAGAQAAKDDPAQSEDKSSASGTVSADYSAADAEVRSPVERFTQQAALRDKSQPAPFDEEST